MSNYVVEVGEKKEPYWIRYIKRRIRQNKNFLPVTTGATGTGKSWTCISIATMLDKKFNIDRVVFDLKDLLILINSGTLYKGAVVVVEEAGVLSNNRNWQSANNRLLNYLLQTFRNLNIIVIFNCPFIDFFDSASRKLLHAQWVLVGIDKEKRETLVKPYFLKYVPSRSKLFTLWMKVITPDGRVPVKLWRVPAPSQELIDAYEVKKKAFTDKLNASLLQSLEKTDRKSEVRENLTIIRPFIPLKALTPLQEQILDCLRNGITKQKDIGVKLGKAQAHINQCMQSLRKKGYNIGKYGEFKEYPLYTPHTPPLVRISSLQNGKNKPTEPTTEQQSN